jgi:hypothetical protein
MSNCLHFGVPESHREYFCSPLVNEHMIVFIKKHHSYYLFHKTKMDYTFPGPPILKREETNRGQGWTLREVW